MATKKTATSGTTRTAAKKSAAKKSPAKKAGAKKSPAKRAATRKSSTASTKRTEADRSDEGGSTAKKTSSRSSSRGSEGSSDGSRRRAGAPRAAAGKKMTAPKVAALAAQQLLQLTGREVEGVTGLERTDDGWLVEVEVVEVRRIPDTTDVLALYELTVDEDGDLEGYRRLQRYVRGAPNQERD
jgi:hypothetical protein